MGRGGGRQDGGRLSSGDLAPQVSVLDGVCQLPRLVGEDGFGPILLQDVLPQLGEALVDLPGDLAGQAAEHAGQRPFRDRGHDSIGGQSAEVTCSRTESVNSST